MCILNYKDISHSKFSIAWIIVVVVVVGVLIIAKLNSKFFVSLLLLDFYNVIKNKERKSNKNNKRRRRKRKTRKVEIETKE